MGKKVSIVLGNGFTIDFLKFLSLHNPDIDGKINVNNLFSDGSELKWPLDNRPGFLSYKHCPHLWMVGARSYLTSDKTLEILERVVTCANVYSLKKNDQIIDKTGNGFLQAYKELISYLKYLFIHYNSIIPNIPDEVADWSWAKFLTQLNNDQNVESVIVISYNYDIWLERILDKLNIEYSIPLLNNNPDAKIQIFKPHGSISYQHYKPLPKDSFSINYNTFFVDCAVSDIRVSYTDLDNHTPVSFLIPPAGEAGRSGTTWAQSIRSECSSKMSTFSEGDLAVICGLSYWHVDRAEIDTILNSMHSGMDVVHVNPFPSQTLDAVLNSLFFNYTHLPSSKLLENHPI
ncbi:hypothetical protein [Aeromonas jandaei]|uniref:hypothetical protein n=1 Tax=Aeromonas jandaei TaxID=650 RepID=UPI00191C99EC|nr:hypothetical protein [Aeromonas jandaei]MBL0625949.1 hypothetical protein [Aeromonas jandaei]